jgi:hypothetical protein
MTDKTSLELLKVAKKTLPQIRGYRAKQELKRAVVAAMIELKNDKDPKKPKIL